jgi:hypothetical protein
VVRLQIRAIWRPAGLLTQLALPLTVVLQRRATKAYVDAARGCWLRAADARAASASAAST